MDVGRALDAWSATTGPGLIAARDRDALLVVSCARQVGLTRPLARSLALSAAEEAKAFEAPIRLRALRLDSPDRVALGSFRPNAFGCGVFSEIAPHRIAQ
jgi:hypothetical protein